MYNACTTGKLPSIETMCLYGLSGCNGTNPIALFECYKKVVKYDKLTEKDLSDAMKKGTLENLIMKSPSIQNDPYFLEVIKSGGLKVPPSKNYFECHTCGFYSATHHACKCFKDINP